MKSEEIIKNIANIPFVQHFIKAFPKSNVYLVGGAVRDALMGIESSDIDFVIENLSDETLIALLESEGKVVDVFGRTFGVVKFKPHDSDETYDIALPRAEKYTPGQRRKHAQVELENITIYDDLARRDFTINAMAIDLREYLPKTPAKLVEESDGIIKTVIDPYHGLEDLHDKTIRAVSNPIERFDEDPTRILRGIRFAVQFGFTIEPETLSAMRELGPQICAEYIAEDGCRLQRVSMEMIGQEFMKALDKNPRTTVELFDESEVLKLLVPEIAELKGVQQPPQFHSEGDVFVHTLLSLLNLSSQANLATKLATLLHDIGKAKTFQSEKETGDRIRFNNHAEIGAEMARSICRRFCLSNEITKEVIWLIENHINIFHSFFHMRPEKQKAFVRNQYFDDLIVLAKADTLASIFPDGKPNLGVYPKVLEIAGQIKAKDRNEPTQIINGREIIEILKDKNQAFNEAEHGKYIGDLKKNINTLYDRGEIKTKVEALLYLRKLVGTTDHAKKRERDQKRKR